jgi:hypothetical protein
MIINGNLISISVNLDVFHDVAQLCHNPAGNAAGFCSRQYHDAETPIANVRNELYNQ